MSTLYGGFSTSIKKIYYILLIKISAFMKKN